jgi:hypothetical protein
MAMMVQGAGGGGGGGSYDAETVAWYTRIGALGGSVTTQEKDWANALILAIKGETYGAKIIYLLPFIGTSIAAHRVPLRDTLAKGAATNGGASPFVDADCTNNGIANPTEKAAYLDTKIIPQDVNSNNIGLGWYERAIGFGTGVEPMGVYDSTTAGNTRCVIDLRSNVQRFFYCTTSNGASVATTAGNAHYYGQRSSATLRRLYKNGSTLASNTTSDSGFGNNAYSILAMVMQNHLGIASYWKGRGACAYVTDGTLSDADVAAFHTLLGTYLITPTGR